MTLSEAEISAIVERASEGDHSFTRPLWAVRLTLMLRALADLEVRPGRATPLVNLCEMGARYGWRDLEAKISPNLLTRISPKARASIIHDLRHRLEQVTRPCLELEQKSFGLALDALGVRRPNPKLTERMFLGDRPSQRLFLMFANFPVLARLWCQLIWQWREQVTEVLVRFMKDRTALSRVFFSGKPIKTILDCRCSLSDPHNHGRMVMQLHFGAGPVLYKPRSGDGEWEWGSLLEWMNVQSFRPNLRTGRVLRRKGYCWMEWIDPAPCKSRAAARRYYERIGGLIAAAYLLKAVDCHRDNLIAAGENPILVDAEALWHVPPSTNVQTPFSLLDRMGFFPDPNPRSLQSRSSVLNRSEMAKYRRELMNGFSRAWECIHGTKDRRRAFARRLRRIQSRKGRRIYRATEKYAAIRRASIRPAVLRSGVERHRLIARLCKTSLAASEVIAAEIEALTRLDIPYFVRGSQEPIVLERSGMPRDLREALRRLFVQAL